MSEHGYGWWQAADGEWYPPEQHPEHNPNDPSSYGWWEAADGNRYPASQHPEYRAAPTGSEPAAPGPTADSPAVRPSDSPAASPTVMMSVPSNPSDPAPPSMTAPSPPPTLAASSTPPFNPPPGSAAGSPPPPGSSSPPTGYPAPSAQPAPGTGFTPAVIAALIASALMAVGSVLPWATIDLGFVKESIGGLDGDGAITLGLGVATAVLAVLSKGRKKGFAIGAIVTAALGVLIAVIDIADVRSTFNGVGFDAGVSVGIGLWLVLVASIAAAVACVKIILDSRR